jgi:hypothetical protein
VQHAEDYDLWLRLAEVGRIANLPDVLLSYRLHAGAASARNNVAQVLAALAARGAARLRRSGKPDPLGAADVRAPLAYRATQRMMADAMPRPEFALAFFRGLLGRETELGSISEWSRRYWRYVLWDIDGRGGAMMILLLVHNMLRRRRAVGRPDAVSVLGAGHRRSPSGRRAADRAERALLARCRQRESAAVLRLINARKRLQYSYFR